MPDINSCFCTNCKQKYSYEKDGTECKCGGIILIYRHWEMLNNLDSKSSKEGEKSDVHYHGDTQSGPKQSQ